MFGQGPHQVLAVTTAPGDRTQTIIGALVLGAVLYVVARGDLGKWASIWAGQGPAQAQASAAGGGLMSMLFPVAPTPSSVVTALPGTQAQGTPGAPTPSGSNAATPVLPGTTPSGWGVFSGLDGLFGSSPAY